MEVEETSWIAMRRGNSRTSHGTIKNGFESEGVDGPSSVLVEVVLKVVLGKII